MRMATPDSPPAPEQGREPDRRSLPAELRCLAPIYLLVLDDDPAMCRFLVEALASDLFLVDAASALQDFEPRLRARPYHLIILDYVIPGLSAEQLFKWVQTHQPEAGIIVITGYPSIDSALACLRARTFDYLTKPFSAGQLQEAVHRYLMSKGLLRLSEGALREALGRAIRDQRKARDLTLAQLADRAGVSLGYLSQIELGRNSASVETLYRIALALGVRLGDLFQTLEARS